MKFVVIYWVGPENVYAAATPRSTGAYERQIDNHGIDRGPLGDMERDLQLNGYQTEIMPVTIALALMDRRYYRNKIQTSAALLSASM